MFLLEIPCPFLCMLFFLKNDEHDNIVISRINVLKVLLEQETERLIKYNKLTLLNRKKISFLYIWQNSFLFKYLNGGWTASVFLSKIHRN